MPMLQFKMGNWENLNNTAKAPITPGTVYITKDERSMYVDIDSTTRIRINDIIQHASATDALPPFNPDAFYYFSAENALMKYNGVDAQGKHLWTQLNSTADVEDKVKELTTRVGTLETAVGTANDAASATGTLYARVKQNAADVAKAQAQADKGVADAATAKAQADKGVADAAKAQAQANTNKSAIDGLKATTESQATAISGLDGRLDTAEKDIDTLQADLDVVEGLLGSSTDGSEKNTAFGRIKALETTSGTHTEQISDLSTDLEALTRRVGTNETNIGKNTTAIGVNAEAIESLKKAVGTGADGLATKVANLTERMSDAESDITGLDGRLKTAEGNIDALETKTGGLETTVGQHTTSISDLNKTVGTHTTDIKNLQDAHNGLKDRVKANEDAIGKSTDTANANGSLYARIKQNVADISSVSGRVEVLETSVTTLKGDANTPGSVANSVKTATDALRKELQNEIDSDIIAANAMEYKDGLASLAALQGLTKVKIGDTYIVTSDFKLADNTQAYAGDLLIAKGTEGADGYITAATLQWNHVNTGYKQNQEQQLTGKNNEILLSSYLAPDSGDNGKIAFTVEQNCSATVKVANNTVTIGIEWGSFD